MKNCPFCHADWQERIRCYQCGWSQGELPWAPVPWEKASFFSLSLPWWRTLWLLLSDTRGFFRRMAPHGNLWRAWVFVLPLFVAIAVASVGNVYQFMGLLDQVSEEVRHNFWVMSEPLLLQYEHVNWRDGWLNSIAVVAFLAEFLFFWFIGMLGYAFVLHVSLTVLGIRYIRLLTLFRYLCYAAVPFVILLLLHLGFKSLEFSLVEPGTAGMISDPTISFWKTTAYLILLAWSYWVLVMALIESQRIPSRLAHSAVLLSISLTVVFFMMSFK